MAGLKLLNPASVAPSGPFSHGLVIPAGHDIIVTAGQIGTTDAEGTIPESYEEQVSAAVQNLGRVLAEAGATPKDIIKLTYYIVDYDVSIRPVHINALLKFLDGHRPGTALIGVARLGNPKLKFEIEAIAAVKPGCPHVGHSKRNSPRLSSRRMLASGSLQYSDCHSSRLFCQRLRSTCMCSAVASPYCSSRIQSVSRGSWRSPSRAVPPLACRAAAPSQWTWLAFVG
ncbi:hypothetical protein VTK73DRAFT_10306 [Phialemonium thermophilum]|uniref:Uncharacterized protein n=1 Tax=Phialemonium thermophilum TaxID=223376 RepID=A0ABR3VXA8_9PEZI